MYYKEALNKYNDKNYLEAIQTIYLESKRKLNITKLKLNSISKNLDEMLKGKSIEEIQIILRKNYEIHMKNLDDINIEIQLSQLSYLNYKEYSEYIKKEIELLKSKIDIVSGEVKISNKSKI